MKSRRKTRLGLVLLVAGVLSFVSGLGHNKYYEVKMEKARALVSEKVYELEKKLEKDPNLPARMFDKDFWEKSEIAESIRNSSLRAEKYTKSVPYTKFLIHTGWIFGATGWYLLRRKDYFHVEIKRK